VNVGLTLDFRNPFGRPWREVWEDNLALVVQAEALGFDYFLIQEHFFTRDGYGPSVPVLLAVLAERTSRIRLGSNVYILPLRHPALLAQETAVLDHMSGGRLDVTVGLGHRRAEFETLGIDTKTRGARMDEALEVLTLAWTRRPFRYAGRFYEIEDLEVNPPPLQVPHPPLWVGATTPVAARRAGRHGAHLRGASTAPEFFEAYAQGLEVAGHEPGTTRISRSWPITTTLEDPDRVWARNEESYRLRHGFLDAVRADIGDPALHRDLPAADADDIRRREVIGDPAAVLETLAAAIDGTPLTDLVVIGPAPGSDIRGEGTDSLRLFAAEVLPVVRDWSPAS
jgi:alkanesulfonate monooxygenase SsuD/methylene tetrahydromethanopterin reductase-like flavin-dependent oxidoreductase (luciferase family)